MSPTVVLAVAVVLSGAVDPTSARARARRHEEALTAGEDALSRGDASAALAAALTVDERDRRVDGRRLRWLRARARLGVGDAAAARGDLDALLSPPPADPRLTDEIRRAAATAAAAVGDFAACADHFDDVLVASDEDRVAWATCLRGTPRRQEAHDVVAPGRSPACVALRILLWLEDGAPRQARADALSLVDTAAPTLVLGHARAFHEAGDVLTATALLEGLLTRDDLDDEVVHGAARLLAASGGRAAVARASLLDPTLAEARRDHGDHAGAWRSATSLEGVDRWRQRAALLVDAGAWERLWVLWPRLQAHGLGRDDEVAYAVAFAAFATGRFVEAEAVLDAVSGAATFARATALRAEIKTRRACVAAAAEGPCGR